MANLPKKFDEQGIWNQAYNPDTGLIEFQAYGWDGTNPQKIAVTNDGSLKTS